MAAYRDTNSPPLRPGVIDQGDELLVRLPFYPDLRDALREIGRWDPQERAWRVSWDHQPELESILFEFGLALAVEVEELRRQLRREAPDPFRALFQQLPARLRPPAYRALAKALHPDVGGDLRMMQALNTAFAEGGTAA